MDKELLEIVNTDFPKEDREKVITELFSISLEHVMAESEANLLTTRLSILMLSKGNLKDLIHYVERAKQDFRDVIYWASQQ